MRQLGLSYTPGCPKIQPQDWWTGDKLDKILDSLACLDSITKKLSNLDPC
jgi:hypothetical protein